MSMSYQFKAKIDNLLEMTAAIEDDELKAAMSRFLCILTSGYIEVCMKERIRFYASQTASPNIRNYVESTLQNLTNLKSARIMETLCRFNSDWGHEFQSRITDDLKDAIDTVVANRNNIAHGKDVGITYGRIREYYQKAAKVLTIVNEIVQK